MCGGLVVVDGILISILCFVLVNFVIWWDGDLSWELLDKMMILKWLLESVGIMLLLEGVDYGVVLNNGIKVMFGLFVDILGDWCEEVIWVIVDSSEFCIFLMIYLM